MIWLNFYNCGDCGKDWTAEKAEPFYDDECPECEEVWGSHQSYPRARPMLVQGKQIVGGLIEASADGDFIPGNPDNPKDTGIFRFISGQVLKFLHHESQCKDRGSCVIHNQSNHHMRGWVLYWSFEYNAMRRVCPHMNNHPDPDDRKYWETKPGESWRLNHDCACGCCNG